MRTRVYISIDTECSMAGAWAYPDRRPAGAEKHIFCRNGDGAFGISWIEEELRRFQMRATFFCEMFAAGVIGEAEMRSVTNYLLERGQDVQLHVHPTFYHYAGYLRSGDPAQRQARSTLSDFIGAYSDQEQYNLLAEAREIFERCVGRRPVAFRAGSYAANLGTLRALARLDIPIDSSYNPVYASVSFPGAGLQVNRGQQLAGVWELPVTVTRTHFPDRGSWKPLEISAISYAEARAALLAAQQAGMRHIVLVFHCFSLVKPRDIFYSKFRPNQIVIRRFRRLLDFLARHSSQFEVATFDGLAENLSELAETQPAIVPDLGRWKPPARKFVQGLNQIYWV